MIAGSNDAVVGDYFNLGGMQPVTLEVVVQKLLRATGTGSYKLVPFPDDRKRIDIGSAFSSFMKFHFATGWKPNISLDEGLAKTVAYYRRYKSHYW